MSIDTYAHWRNIYHQKKSDQVSWFKPHLDLSLRMLANAGLNSSSCIIDVGAGASTLVDDLVERGVKTITVLDISAEALQEEHRTPSHATQKFIYCHFEKVS